MRRVLRAALVCVVVLAVLAGGAGLYAYRAYDAPGPLPEARAVVVPRGGLEGIADALARESPLPGPARAPR